MPGKSGCISHTLACRRRSRAVAGSVPLMPSAPGPTVLEGRQVRLEPLADSHVSALFVAGGRDDEVWRWLSAPTPRTEADLQEIVSRRLQEVDDGKRVA